MKYYEIWNTISERKAECTEMCTTLDIAKDHLKNNHSDWYRPKGTGSIYEIELIVENSGTITKNSKLVYEVL